MLKVPPIILPFRERGAGFGVMERQFIGSIVMTRYNNKTYRIDAIDREQNVMSTFEVGYDHKV